MKRLYCVVLALCFLRCTVVPGLSEAQEGEWTLFESPYGFSLWYDARLYMIEDNREDGATVLYPLELYTPLESRDESGRIAVPKDEKIQAGIRIEQPAPPVDEDWTPPANRVSVERELDIAWPYFCTTMPLEGGVQGPYAVDDLFVLLPTGFFSAGIVYPQSDPDGWSEKLWDVLSTLEFSPQPAVDEDFRLDFFQGGAAGMQFTDLIVDEDAEPIVLIPLRAMKDFVLEYLDWDFEIMTPTVAMTLYAATILSPGNSLRVSCYFEDVMPNLRVRYTDAEGEAQCFYVFQSGRDGSLMLLTESEL